MELEASMKKLSMLFLTLGLAVFAICTSFASNSSSHRDQPTTFLGPTLTENYATLLTEDTAISLLGELGVRNLRANGTFGLKLNESQNLKLSLEGLTQRIRYGFFSGDTDQWVSQGAIGLGYEYDFLDTCYQPQFDIDAYFSHANSKNLTTRTGTLINTTILTQTFANNRRIAGSNAEGVAPGVSITPWQGARIGADLNYDNVRYDTKYREDDDATGFGGTVHLSQQIIDNIGFGVSAAWRRPFNNYAAGISWTDCPYFGSWTVGVDGEYTVGKKRLPDTYNVGVFASYAIDPTPKAAPISLKGESVIGDPPGKASPLLASSNANFLSFTQRPAVYLPQVLAIPDENVTILNATSCPRPTIGATPLPSTIDLQGFPNPNLVLESSQFFSGSNLNYSINLNPAAAGSGQFITVNPTTGTVTGFITAEPTYILTITATNSCGSVSQTTTINVNEGLLKN